MAKKTIQQIIGDERRGKKISQEKLAEMIGVSRGMYGHIESGRARLTVDVLMKVCDALDIKVLLVDENGILN